MTNDILIKVEKIAAIGNEHIENIKAEHSGNISENIKKDWLSGLFYFFDVAFRQGRNDEISAEIADIVKAEIMAVFAGTSKSAKFEELQMELWQSMEDRLSGKIGRGKTGKNIDVKMTIDAFDFIAALPLAFTKNIVKYTIDKIKKGRTEEVYEKLQKIRAVGPKVSALFIRETAYIFGLKNHFTDHDISYLQPADPWISEISRKIGLIDSEDEPDEIRKKINFACRTLNVSSIAYNQGTYQIGLYSQDILLRNLTKL